jgi:ATP-dependent helicase/nuclease subunit A
MSTGRLGSKAGLTEEQRAVLEARRGEVFVSAAAGSGKTSLLVECYLAALLDDGLSPEQLPTVTFTRKAAAEMKDRIRRGLLARGREDLAARMDQAPIGTIHSFCRRLLASDPVGAGVDPLARVLDEERAAILMHAVWREVWQETVMAASAEEVRLLAKWRKDLQKEVPELYRRLRQMGLAHPSFSLTPPLGWETARQKLRRALNELHSEAAPLAERSKTAEVLLDGIEAARGWASAASPGRPDLRTSGAIRLPLNGPRALRPLVVEARSALTEARLALAGHELLAVGRLIDDLLDRLHSSLEKRKRQEGHLDFQDLELLALAYVRGGGPSLPVGSRLLVDEFQDTNSLQFALFRQLGTASRLTVGDEYQSIYAFRGADVEVFRRVRAELSGEGPAAERSLHRLTYNFRSSAEVLSAVNRLFGSQALFGDQFTALKAGRASAAPETGRPTSGHAAELLLMDRESCADDEDGWQAAEARGVAGRIARLTEHEGWRPRDVVVLLATFTHVEWYARALDEHGIPAYVVGGKGYYAREEVTDVLALLTLVVNPHDDLALVTVLRSPFVSVLDDTLYLLRRAAGRRGRFLWEGAKGEVPDLPSDERMKLDAFASRLELLRARLGTPGMSALIEHALEIFDYDLAVLNTPDGRRRFANLRKLMRLADEYEEIAGPDLTGLVDYLRQRRDLVAREASAPVLSEEQDVVRVMTVHQAKGLEFPVVVVAGIGSDGGPPGPPACLVDQHGAGALVLRGSKAGFEEVDLSLGSAAAILADERRRRHEEALRLHYVAATRAQEKLILTGSLRAGSSGGRGRVLAAIMQSAELPGVPVEGEVLRPWSDVDLVVSRLAADGHERERAGVARPEAPSATPEAAYPAENWTAATGPMPRRALEAHSASRLPGVKRVSFSSLALYDRCPFRFYLERILGLGAGSVPDGRRDGDGSTSLDGSDDGSGLVHAVDRGGDDEVEGRDMGTLVHRCLELVDLREEPAPDELESLISAVAADTSVSLDSVARARAAALVRAFWRSPVATWTGLQAAQKEVPFVFSREGMLVHGVVDLLLPSASGWRMVDYKTNVLAGRTPAAAVEPYLVQAQLYALAGLLAGAESVATTFLFLEAPADPVELRYGAVDVEKLGEKLDSVLESLRTGEYPRLDRCGGCEQAGLCRALARGEVAGGA